MRVLIIYFFIDPFSVLGQTRLALPFCYPEHIYFLFFFFPFKKPVDLFYYFAVKDIYIFFKTVKKN